MKECCRCKESLREKEFGRHKRNIDGLQRWCKDCSRAYSNRYRRDNSAYYADKSKENNKKESRKKYMREYMNNYNKNTKNIGKQKIRIAVRRAVRLGEIVKLDVCQYPTCSSTKLEAHHEDYRMPFHVKWLCKKHHGLANSIQRRFPLEYQSVNIF